MARLLCLLLILLGVIVSSSGQQTLRSVSYSTRTANQEYPRNDFVDDWMMTPTISSGQAAGRLRYMPDPTGSGRTVLRVQYNENESGGSSAMGFKAPLQPGYTRLWFQYEMMFDKDFDFLLGGKLPGLAGSDTPGVAPTGCVDDGSFPGCSARMMWQCKEMIMLDKYYCNATVTHNVLESYLYYPGKHERCGDYFMFCKSTDGIYNPPMGMDNGECSQPKVLETNRWYTITQLVALNDIGADGEPIYNGYLEHYVDGQLRLHHEGMLLRRALNVTLSTIAMETFFGGSTAEWAPATHQYSYFNNFLVTQSNPNPNITEFSPNRPRRYRAKP